MSLFSTDRQRLMVVSGFCDLGTALTFLGEAHDQLGLFICGEHLANVLAKHGTFAGNFCKFKTDGFAGTSVVADASAKLKQTV
jgi:hypothetical protein